MQVVSSGNPEYRKPERDSGMLQIVALIKHLLTVKVKGL